MTEHIATEHIVVVGGGMVAHRFVEALRSRDTDGAYRVTVCAQEPRRPYDRVALTSYFTGRDPEDLELGEPSLWDDPLVELRRDHTVVGIDRDAQTVTAANGDVTAYDHLVLATGTYAWMPPIKGADLSGVFLYRTIDDVAAIRGYVEALRAERGGVLRGAVIGGGLLGLEAAGALLELGLTATVVQSAPRLMNVQVDEAGGAALARLVTKLGVSVLVNARTERLVPGRTGAVGSLKFDDGSEIAADVVIVAAGVRPRDELASGAGLTLGARGGVTVDDQCLTDDPRISAIGEVASIQGGWVGLVAPGYTMAEIAVDRLLGGTSTYPGTDTSAKLKLLGVDVASFGDAFATTPGALELVFADPVAGVYKKLVLTDDARVLLGGILVGDASAYASLRPMVGAELPGDPALWLLPEGAGERPQLDLPDTATVCSCNNVSAGTIRAAVTEHECHDLSTLKVCTKAGTACGSCVPLAKKLLTAEMTKAGLEVSNAMCEHFAMSRAELFQAVKVAGFTRFSEIIDRLGTGRGCDICKPAIGSILASLYNEHVLAADRAALQDTNDRVMANMQKDGTYSVVPRVPGGEITPDKLIVIGEVAKEFGLYTKITGGQRIDLFGARLEQLPSIWQRLVDAGMESGHAYGKSLRTVKSCVGSTWCRYGVQDSVGMAIALELRYRGLRSPHKIKLGVSGCARECAEARGKDVGVIATEKGWNVYVGGNGGFEPRHAQLLVEDVDDETLLRVIDRYLMFYIRTADRLQRTAPWQEDFEGGLDRLREIIVDDALGICDELDAHMSRHIDTYEDEWAAVLRDPVRLQQFASFVNAPDTPDPSLAYVEQRGQRRPASAAERVGAVLIAPATLQVRA
jgi:nitrite reductase (NADH) large subunit